MSGIIESLLGALGTCLDCSSAIILAIGLGFTTVPTAFAFLVAANGMLLSGQVSPVCVPSELIILINGYSKDKRERSSIILIAGIVIAILGFSGLMGWIIEFIGSGILCAIMAGVGIMIFKVSIDLMRDQPLPGIASAITAFAVYFLTENLIYTLICCVIAATLVWNIFKKDYIKTLPKIDISSDKIEFTKPLINTTVIRGALGAVTLMFGEIISDGTLTAQFAGITPSTNAMSMYVGVGNILSALFGGAPVSTIISGTGTAPHPLFSGVMVMVFMVIILFTKLIPRIKNYIPTQGLAGFLCVLAVLVIFPENAATSLTAQPVVATVTMLVTGFIDPFFGMCAGILVRFITGILI